MKHQVSFVLLIDDDESTNFFHKLMVEEAAVTNHILVAQKGSEGIDFLKNELSKQETINGLVFIDINMPGMDGWMVADEINKMNPGLLTKLKIFMVSASENPKDIERIKINPLIMGYVPKPLHSEKIKQLLL